ncbi:hypothetical protein PVK06_040201 [Gossypium arboreum]|uniref:Zinc knuckle CX2CX4HX4C domain-containing protein n=1 Tax=Gossypium arboreum TaxID=29729 RepID=A0ABR0N4X0_GOSAR|nr:hypothetical protein PVK06_040201 [Gossypium arboreum]
MDLERVLKGSPWTFNNHVLMLHWPEKKEDPLKVPLIFACFWVQIHEVPPSFYIETLAHQIEGFLGNFLEFDGTNLGKGLCTYLHVREQLDVRRPLKMKNKVMFSVVACSYVSFKYERLTLFCFFYGRLGHSDSFCQAKMALGFDVAEMGWDLSLRAQSRRALALAVYGYEKIGKG